MIVSLLCVEKGVRRNLERVAQSDFIYFASFVVMVTMYTTAPHNTPNQNKEPAKENVLLYTTYDRIKAALFFDCFWYMLVFLLCYTKAGRELYVEY